MPIYKRRWFQISVLVLLSIMIGFGVFYSTTYKQFSARAELITSCIMSLKVDEQNTCSEETDFIMQTFRTDKDMLLAKCSILGDDLLQDAIDYPYSVRVCFRDIGILK